MTKRAANESGFYDLPEAEQIERLGALARDVLGCWDVTEAQVSPAAYRENMTFRVDAGARGRFALRIHQAGYRSDDEIRSELAFMGALREGGLRTPEVVPAADGSPFVVVEHSAVPEARQCDLFEWIDGRELRAAGRATPLAGDALAEAYTELGRQAATLANVAARWQRPTGFTRPAWDAEGIFGATAHLGDWRRLARLTPAQRVLFERLAERLRADFAAFGHAPDRWGLGHGDFLPENLMVCDDGLRLLDFDDCGEGWTLFEFATGLFDQLGEPPFDACLAALVTGFREHRALPDDHLTLLPAFFLARMLSYVGWCATRSHLDKAAAIAPRLLAALETFGPPYLADDVG